MSKLVSINLMGKFINNQSIVDCLKGSECTYIFDGELAMGMREGDDINIDYYSLTDEDQSLELVFKKWPEVASINVEMHLGNWIQRVTLYVDQKNCISFLIEGSRKELNSGITDFSWYLNNLIPQFINGKFHLTSVVCNEYN